MKGLIPVYAENLCKPFRSVIIRKGGCFFVFLMSHSSRFCILSFIFGQNASQEMKHSTYVHQNSFSYNIIYLSFEKAVIITYIM